jgi:two-component system response regulator GlrR
VTDSTICLYGESGTGKELIGKAVHAMSRRARGPFIAINCGAIPEGLLENELFGHVKGAYTGADQVHRGLLRQADGGTLFLDEVGELPLALQVKFLRVLQEQEFYPLGAGQPTKANFRLIAATNQDLWEAVCSGKFREDLYYRIHVIPVVLPPLRERPEDIPLLAQHFLQHFAYAIHKGIKGFSSEAMQLLMVYHWPGNVRELANVVERAVVLATEDVITADLILLGKQPSRPSQSKLLLFKDARAAFERAYLIQVLTATRGNISRAAELCGRHRAEVYRLLRKNNLDPTSFKDIFE